MNRLALILAGAAVFACFAQACSSNDDADDDDDDTGTSSGSHPDASTGRATSSSSSSSSGAASSSSSGGSTSSSSSSGSPDAGNRCLAAADRAQARYAECGIVVPILDGGTPVECTDEKATDDEHDAQCVQDASCPALRGDADAGDDADAYFACISE
jgi:hypothetical protein